MYIQGDLYKPRYDTDEAFLTALVPVVEKLLANGIFVIDTKNLKDESLGVLYRCCTFDNGRPECDFFVSKSIFDRFFERDLGNDIPLEIVLNEK